MNVVSVDSAAPPSSTQPLVLAIGKFDGVHIGHQAILSAAKEFLDLPLAVVKPRPFLAVMSFAPHPAWVLGEREEYQRSLTPSAEKRRLLALQGVERLYEVEFSKAYAAIPADVFVSEHLQPLRLRRLVVGSDFTFGQGGKATARDLRLLCEAIGVPVTVVSDVEENGVKVSSSQIRRHLHAGRVEAAEALLGRPYSVFGEVVAGDQVGRTIGFPTANLCGIDEYVLPSAGVYAVAAQIGPTEGQTWFGVANIGWRPTVNGTDLRVEAHLFGFSGDLYGSRLRLSFLRRVRGEQKFAGLSELQTQIGDDVRFVKQMLGVL